MLLSLLAKSEISKIGDGVGIGNGGAACAGEMLMTDDKEINKSPIFSGHEHQTADNSMIVSSVCMLLGVLVFPFVVTRLVIVCLRHDPYRSSVNHK